VDRTIALRLGAAVRFSDRWEGNVATIDVDEDWEVINLTITRGLLRWKSSVKLPFAAVVERSAGHVAFDCTSRQAFAREIPPIAAPARPLSVNTPVSLAGGVLAGLMVRQNFVEAILIHEWAGQRRRLKIPVEKTVFEGKMLRLLGQSERLPVYHSDDGILSSIRNALSASSDLSPDEKRSVIASVDNGAVRLYGNVRTKTARVNAGRIAAAVDGVSTVTNEIVDDLALEIDLGQLLERSGTQRAADVQARSSLGEVTLFGRAASPNAADEIVRVVSRAPGVRTVKSRIGIRAAHAKTLPL